MWGGLRISGKAKYLGMFLGPDRGDDSWIAPLAKMLDRARTWRSIGLGMLHTIEAYQVFISSVLSFVGQLYLLPPSFSNTEASCCSLLFPGPRGWMSPEVLKLLKVVSFPCNLADPPSTTLASRARTANFEVSIEGFNIFDRAVRLRSLCNSQANTTRRHQFKYYIDNSFIFNLESALLQLKANEVKLGSATTLLRSDPDSKVGWQNQASKIFKQFAGLSINIHVRKRFDRWKIAVLPGHRQQRWLKSISASAQLLPPRVQAVQIRTALNGWLTRIVWFRLWE